MTKPASHTIGYRKHPAPYGGLKVLEQKYDVEHSFDIIKIKIIGDKTLDYDPTKIHLSERHTGTQTYRDLIEGIDYFITGIGSQYGNTLSALHPSTTFTLTIRHDEEIFFSLDEGAFESVHGQQSIVHKPIVFALFETERVVYTSPKDQYKHEYPKDYLNKNSDGKLVKGYPDNYFDNPSHDITRYFGTGDDTFRSGAGNDVLYGGEGDDALYGGKGSDILNGQTGNDRLYGEEGRDTLLGEGGNDRLYGGDGSDKLLGGKGDDVLVGGKDGDIYIFNIAEEGHNFISEESGNDNITLYFSDPGITFDIKELQQSVLFAIVDHYDLKITLAGLNDWSVTIKDWTEKDNRIESLTFLANTDVGVAKKADGKDTDHLYGGTKIDDIKFTTTPTSILHLSGNNSSSENEDSGLLGLSQFDTADF